MNAAYKVGWLPVGALFVALVSVLAFLYVRAQAYDDAGYFETSRCCASSSRWTRSGSRMR